MNAKLHNREKSINFAVSTLIITMRTRILTLALTLVAALAAWGAMVNPVHWTMSGKPVADGVEVTLTAVVDDDWHMYAMDLPSGGPHALEVNWTATGAEAVGKLSVSPAVHREHDANFDMDLAWWEHRVTLKQRFKTRPGERYDITADVHYQACNGVTNMCAAPADYHHSISGTAAGVAPADTAAAPAVAVAVDSVAPDTAAVVTAAPIGDTWAPVTVAASAAEGAGSSSLWWLFWACFGGGLLALFTPCVWPIIPLTVSMFLKRSSSRGAAISGAVAYGLSIVVIYVALGLLVTILFGADALNAIATSAVCNIFFFVLLVVFAISFFGAFEITLPASWSTRLDKAAGGTTGLLSIFLMAFTLVIVSFSCTGPIIGTLLVTAATGGSRLAPAVGMLGFSIALALPFALFALFPAWLKRMPRSGGWMQTVKITLGFLELALSLKFLSVADLAYGWHVLDREVFLALWIATFLMLGLYLLGVYRFESEGEQPQGGVGVTRVMLGLCSLAFTAYLLPGLWGAPLRATSAFVPPMYTQDFVLDTRASTVDVVDDYDRAIELSRSSGKPIFIDFSGYGCVNCRKMEGAVLDRPQVKSLLERDFITARLMVDDRTPLASPRVVTENGESLTLTTVGALWSYLQRSKFGANSQPYYVIVDSDGKLLAGPRAYDEDIDAFVDFLTLTK